MGIVTEFAVNARTKLRVDVPGHNEVFQFLAECDTLFGIKRCGHCESENLSFKYTTPQGNEYYSIKCNDCGYEFKFGIRKEDRMLFPKKWEPPYRRDSELQDAQTSDTDKPTSASRYGSATPGADIPF